MFFLILWINLQASVITMCKNDYLPHIRQLESFDPSSDEYSKLWRLPMVISGASISISDNADPPMPYGSSRCGMLTRLLDNYCHAGFRCPYPSCGMYLGYGTPRIPGGMENLNKLCMPCASPQWMLDHWVGFHMRMDGRLACPGKLDQQYCHAGGENHCDYVTSSALNLERHLYQPIHDTDTLSNASKLAKDVQETRFRRLEKMPGVVYYDPQLYDAQNRHFDYAVREWNATHRDREPKCHLEKIYDDFVALFGSYDAVYDINLGDQVITPAVQQWPIHPRTSVAPAPVTGKLIAKPEVLFALSSVGLHHHCICLLKCFPCKTSPLYFPPYLEKFNERCLSGLPNPMPQCA